MKAKQKSIRVFEIECESLTDFEAYLNKNGVLLNGFLLLLKGDSKGLFAKECKKRGLCYALFGECDEDALIAKKDSPKELPEIVEPPRPEAKTGEQQTTVTVKKTTLKAQASLPIETKMVEPIKELPKTVVIAKNLRSGESISTDADVTILGRINSGAKVKTSGNATILEAVDGDVEAWGEYVMIKTIGKGTVSFCGEQIKKEFLDGKMKLVTFDGKLSLKDV
jgi:septum site-determining protein MinC